MNIYALNILLWAIGITVIAVAAALFHPPVALNIACSGVYGFWCAMRFPWVAVRR